MLFRSSINNKTTQAKSSNKNSGINKNASTVSKKDSPNNGGNKNYKKGSIAAYANMLARDTGDKDKKEYRINSQSSGKSQTEKKMADKKKILIADDFQLLREDLTELINNQRDMEVVGTASSGKEIVNLARNTEYDLILMDIEMETMNAGILATQEIREADPEAGIIFLTAHETREMIVTAMGAGALDYIVKGCEDEEILYHIRCALKGNPIMSNKIHETVMQEYARLQQSEKSLLFFINNISKLTATEREMIKLLLQGYKVHEIAEARSVEVSTIKTQIKGLLRKFGCSRTKEIVQIIRELNIEHLF